MNYEDKSFARRVLYSALLYGVNTVTGIRTYVLVYCICLQEIRTRERTKNTYLLIDQKTKYPPELYGARILQFLNGQ